MSNIGEPSCSKDYRLSLSISDSQIVQKLHLFLKPLDEILRCHICFEYYDTCMITKCCHGYCSLCIRKYMSFKSQCPECFQEAAEPELRSNRQIDQVLVVYKNIKKYLESLGFSTLLSSKNLVNDSIVNSQISDKQKEISSSYEQIDQNVSFSEEPNVNLSFCDEPDGNTSVCDRLDESSSASSQELPSSSDVTSPIKISDCRTLVTSGNNDSPTHGNKVPCPVCSSMVFQGAINAHLDMCLQQEVVAIRAKRKPLPKLVYHLMSEKDIKKRLKEYGLNTTGNKQCLIRRHKSFLILYNAECDSLNPRPVSELVNQLEVEEIEMKSSEYKLFQCDKKSAPENITEEHEEYLRHNKPQFDALVNDIRCRELKLEIVSPSKPTVYNISNLDSNLDSAQNSTATQIESMHCEPSNFDQTVLSDDTGMEVEERINTDSPLEPENIPCLVCGAISSGIHFGVVTCKACFSFFQRNHSFVPKNRCVNKCVIDQHTRHRCMYCRLQKCFAVGMSVSALVPQQCKESDLISDVDISLLTPIVVMEPIQTCDDSILYNSLGANNDRVELQADPANKLEIEAKKYMKGLPTDPPDIKVKIPPEVHPQLPLRSSQRNRQSRISDARPTRTSKRKITRTSN